PSTGPCTSTSTTTTPEAAPVGRPMFAVGVCLHHASTWPGSVVASSNPCSAIGRFPPGRHGNTGTPAAANSRAAADSGQDSVIRDRVAANAPCSGITAPAPNPATRPRSLVPAAVPPADPALAVQAPTSRP